jgi:hypothetical protein
VNDLRANRINPAEESKEFCTPLLASADQTNTTIAHEQSKAKLDRFRIQRATRLAWRLLQTKTNHHSNRKIKAITSSTTGWWAAASRPPTPRQAGEGPLSPFFLETASTAIEKPSAFVWRVLDA